MNWEKLGPNLSFTVENKASNLNKIRLLCFKRNEWAIPLPQILRIYQWVGENMFPIEKNEILNPSWIGKAWNKNVDYLMYNMSNENTSTSSLHSKQWFHEEQEPKYI